MSWIHGARARLRLLLSRRAAERRFDDEIAFHVEMETERLMRQGGLDATEARRQALVAFGGVDRYKEELREGRGLAWLGGLSLDLRLGLRMLAKSPGLTLVGVVGMAVAVAIGAVSFSIIYNFIGTSIPLDEGERIVAIQNVDARRGVDADRTHLHDLATWREALGAVEILGAYRTVDRNVISAGAPPDPMRVAEMTASGFRIARVPPLMGRYFHEEDERPGAPAVVVIGHAVWRERFGARPDVVGQTIRLGATPHTVVGVMPEGFAFPVNNRVWTPLRLQPSAFARGEAPALKVFGRLAPGASLDDASAQSATIATRLAAAHPESHRHVRAQVLPYALAFFDNPELTWALHLVQVLVTMLLVVIGTNVAILVYARTARRTGEIAVRIALGASRARIVAQLFAEALVLSALAAAVGLAGASVALWNIRAHARRIAGEQVPFWMDFGVTPGLLLYVVGLAVLAAVLVGVLPALKATGRRVQASLQNLGSGGAAMRLGRTWTVLVVAQVAVAVTLLPPVVYVLFVQESLPVGSPVQHPTQEFVTATLHLDREDLGPTTSAQDSLFAHRSAAVRAELVRRLEAEPGVTHVVLASSAPGDERRLRMEAERGGAGAHRVGVAQVELDYFAALEMPILAGRALRPEDAAPEATAVVVNESFVKKLLGGRDALGQRVRRVATDERGDAARAPDTPWLEVVGVVPDFPRDTDDGDLQPRLYEPMGPAAAPLGTRRTVMRRALSQSRPTVADAVAPVTVAVRVKGVPPARFGNRLRELAVAVDPMLRLDDVLPLDEMLRVDMADRILFTAVSSITLSVLLLSAAGIYALVSFTVVRRRREIGIRAALGAGPRRVLVGVLAGAAGQIALGIVVGLALGAALLQGMEGGQGDGRGVLVLLAVAVLMSVVGLGAAFGPARRALSIPPTEALRAE